MPLPKSSTVGPSLAPAAAGRVAFAALLLALLLPAPSAAQPRLAQRLDSLLDNRPLDRNLWGVAVLDARGRLLYGRNAERLFMPASNAKLLVTATAAALLPPDWTVRTSVYAGGPVGDGVLHGDLVLYGRGDPTGGPRCFTPDPVPGPGCALDPFAPFARLASGIVQQGIRRIDGDVIGDGSWFEPAATHPTWEHDDLVWGYAAPVSGLGFRENTITLVVRPDTAIGAAASVTLDPALPGITVENRTLTAPDGADATLEIARDPDDWHYVVSGAIARSSRERRETLAVPDGNRYAALALLQVLADSGVTVLGIARGEADSLAYRAARESRPLAEIASRPLADWIFAILNVSQNWYAETLLKQLGRAFGAAGSWSEGLAVERRFLIDSARVDSTQFLLHDGSGLSAKNLVSPLALARVLRFMRGHPRYPAFGAGLPRSGEVGSLRNRFLDTPLRGRVRAKTGTIGQVNTLSGYIERAADSAAPAAQPLRIFSIQANHHTIGGREMIRAIDSLVARIDPEPPDRSR